MSDDIEQVRIEVREDVYVLEKNGFVYKELLRKHKRKDGALLDSKLYVLVR